MAKTATKKWTEQEAQREAHARIEAANRMDPALAALTPEELAVAVAAREAEKAAMLRARGYDGNDFAIEAPVRTPIVELIEEEPVGSLTDAAVAAPAPAPVPEQPATTVAEVEAQMRAEEARLAEQIAALEEQSKRRLIELAMARAEAENAEEARKAIDVDAALDVHVKHVTAPKRDLAAEQLAEAREAFDRRAKPYRHELAEAAKMLAAFEERYSARLDALGKVERKEWLNGQPSDGKHQHASLAVTHQLMMALEHLNRLRRELPLQFRQFRDELKYLHDWAGVERPPYGSAQQFAVACGQLLGTGATAPSINQGNLRMAASAVATLQAHVDQIVRLLGVVTERQQAGAPPIEFEVPPARRDDADHLPAHVPQDSYLDGAPSIFSKA
jgi:hypothetical protein